MNKSYAQGWADAERDTAYEPKDPKSKTCKAYSRRMLRLCTQSAEMSCDHYWHGARDWHRAYLGESDMACIQDTQKTPQQAKWSYPNDANHTYTKVCRIRGLFHEAFVEDVDGTYHWAVYRYGYDGEVCTPSARNSYAVKLADGKSNDVGEAMYEANSVLERA